MVVSGIDPLSNQIMLPEVLGLVFSGEECRNIKCGLFPKDLMFQANKIFRRSTSTPLAQGETAKARRRILIVLSPRTLVEKLD